MRLSSDEQRALHFVLLLVLLAALARWVETPAPAVVAGETLDLAQHLEASRQALEAERRRQRPLAEGERLDPNRAPADELARLPGIGPALAQRVVAARDEAPFQAPGDLTRVSGIGPRTAERLAPYLDFDRAAIVPRDAVVRQARAAADSAAPLDLNAAGAEQLQRLPGIGPVLAARIIAHRDSVGGFTTPDALLAVPGIGPRTLERLRPLIRAAR